jgi:hypothetical protein
LQELAISSETMRAVAIPDPQPRRAPEGATHEPHLPGRKRAEEVALSREGRRRAALRAEADEPQRPRDLDRALIAVRIGPAPPEPLPDALTRALSEADRLPELRRLAPAKPDPPPPERKGDEAELALPATEDEALPARDPLFPEREALRLPGRETREGDGPRLAREEEPKRVRAGSEREPEPPLGSQSEDAVPVAALAPQVAPLPGAQAGSSSGEERPRPRTVSLYV